MKKVLVSGLIFVFIIVALFKVPIVTFSGTVIGISGYYYDGKAHWNKLIVENANHQIQEAYLFFPPHNWEKANDKYRGKKLKVYKNILGTWRVL